MTRAKIIGTSVQLLLMFVVFVVLFQVSEIGRIIVGADSGGGITTSTTIFVTSAASTQSITTIAFTFYSTVTSFTTSASTFVTVTSVAASTLMSLSTVMSIYTSIATQVVPVIVQQNPLDPYTPIIGAIVGAIVGGGATWRIQRGGTKDQRRRAIVQRKLEKLYTPLFMLIKYHGFIIRNGDKQPNLTYIGEQGKKDLDSIILNYGYLGDDELTKILPQFLGAG